MNDLISRTEAIKTWDKLSKRGRTEFDQVLMTLPSIESSQGWIPITESEPNTADHVLVTYKWDDDDYETSELDYWVNKYEAEHGNEKCQFFHNHIIAWQLKPKPYKGGEDE